MRPLAFFMFTSLTAVCTAAVRYPGWGTLLSVLFVFGVVPVCDWFIGTDARNPDAAETARWSRAWVWSSLLYVYTFTHFALLGYALYAAAHAPWPAVAALGLSTGLYTGGLGITVAHEFGHKNARSFYATAAALLASVWYHHFLIEHTRGHHVRVATPEDPASAAYGESAYRFLPRSLGRSFSSAVELERRRVGTPWSWRNQVTLGVVAQLALTAVAAFLGARVLACFLGQAAVAIGLLELINYIEHYGLVRQKTAAGRFERVTPAHSWNSSHRLTNFIFFNLQRHSDHHATAVIPFTVLKHHDEVPQLPFGYPTMVLLALCPPLWFRVMNPRVTAWRAGAAAPERKAAP